MKKYLFVIDLDGTVLADSSTSKIHKDTIEAINKAKKEGHIVCIATGRPWRSSKKAYEKLGFNTIIANYNGAHIHNPTDYDFIPVTSYMNLNDVMYILGDKEIKNVMTNTAIEGPGWVMLDKRDKSLERVFGYDKAVKLKIGLDVHRLPLRPTGVVFDTKKGVNILKLKDYLQRKYGDLVEFSSWSKGEGLTPVFDMTNLGVTKAKAISLMARYYGISIHNTISIGDGYNDVPMFESTEYSVAMANSSEDIKEIATYATTKTNKQGGVGEFINKFLKDPEFRKELRKIRRVQKHIKDNTTVSH
ncbi:Cof-type HAD-IIB family hydrolase [Candidatus Mycoplasma mahonii]|uniref:Cof-type HAD-IIB family hydrolase n=1 Tax=Candidatus Mycoplasma mahonii TaxID=3004105 RepID=UPI0026EED103|nr:Cof-type HAD-IIB family hydrolase [Candidatus Mycoplasma mahonii]WKX02678.1 Cof-type HAD-IIB family hydrolase [Candidatus Mycoplasma mahonii]